MDPIRNNRIEGVSWCQEGPFNDSFSTSKGDLSGRTMMPIVHPDDDSVEKRVDMVYEEHTAPSLSDDRPSCTRTEQERIHSAVAELNEFSNGKFGQWVCPRRDIFLNGGSSVFQRMYNAVLCESAEIYCIYEQDFDRGCPRQKALFFQKYLGLLNNISSAVFLMLVLKQPNSCEILRQYQQELISELANLKNYFQREHAAFKRDTDFFPRARTQVDNIAIAMQCIAMMIDDEGLLIRDVFEIISGREKNIFCCESSDRQKHLKEKLIDIMKSIAFLKGVPLLFCAVLDDQKDELVVDITGVAEKILIEYREGASCRKGRGTGLQGRKIEIKISEGIIGRQKKMVEIRKLLEDLHSAIGLLVKCDDDLSHAHIFGLRSRLFAILRIIYPFDALPAREKPFANSLSVYTRDSYSTSQGELLMKDIMKPIFDLFIDVLDISWVSLYIEKGAGALFIKQMKESCDDMNALINELLLNSDNKAKLDMLLDIPVCKGKKSMLSQTLSMYYLSRDECVRGLSQCVDSLVNFQRDDEINMVFDYVIAIRSISDVTSLLDVLIDAHEKVVNECNDLLTILKREVKQKKKPRAKEKCHLARELVERIVDSVDIESVVGHMTPLFSFIQESFYPHSDNEQNDDAVHGAVEISDAYSEISDVDLPTETEDGCRIDERSTENDFLIFSDDFVVTDVLGAEERGEKLQEASKADERRERSEDENRLDILLKERREIQKKKGEATFFSQVRRRRDFIRMLDSFSDNLAGRSAKGSHIAVTHELTKKTYVIPFHKELKKGTMNSIIKNIIEDLDEEIQRLSECVTLSAVSFRKDKTPGYHSRSGQ